MNSANLFLVVLVPFLGAAFAPMMPAKSVRAWAMLVAFLTFVFALAVTIATSRGPVQWGMDAGNNFVAAQIGFGFRLSCDGVSGWLTVLTTLLMPLAIFNVPQRTTDGAGGQWFYTWMLVLLGSIVGCFVAGDALLFYFFFELTLVPSLLLIGIWGGPERRAAAGKFFIYTFAGSVFLLIGLIFLAAKAGTFEIGPMIKAAQGLPSGTRGWVAAAFLLGFLVKTPVFPLHTWQATTYSQSPTSVTVILAAVMSKLGTYGLLRFTLPIGFVGAPAGGLYGWVVALCVISIIYGGLIAWVQKDMARIMAFSSVSHLGVCVLAIFAGSTLSLQGALAYMLAHGLSTAALFFLIGMIHERTGTRDITQISGLFKSMPIAGTLLVAFTMASIGLPITSGFVGEFLSLQGVLSGMGLGVAALASLGIILGAIYMLNMVAKVGFGPEKAPDGAILRDLTGRDMAVLMPIAGAILLLGVLPTPVLDSVKPAVVAVQRVSGPEAAKVVGPAVDEAGVFGK